MQMSLTSLQLLQTTKERTEVYINTIFLVHAGKKSISFQSPLEDINTPNTQGPLNDLSGAQGPDDLSRILPTLTIALFCEQSLILLQGKLLSFNFLLPDILG